MLLSDRDARRLRPRRWMLPVGLILLFIILFWREVISVIWLFWTIGITVLGFEPGALPPDLGYAFQVICFNVILGFLWVFVSWLILASSQALLPVRVPLEYAPGHFRLVDRFQEIYRTAFHLLLSIFHVHGRTIFVRDGKQIDSPSELNRQGFGVTVVDFNSAAVFEEQIPPPGVLRALNTSIMNILVSLGLVDKLESPRVRGPGIIFTRPHERIRAVVDLRKQFRIRTQVPCYTRDGLELKANIWVIFTIGQTPDTLQVGYDGEFRRENLRTLTWENLPDTGRMRLAGFSDDLDDADRREIHQYARVAGRLQEIGEYMPLPAGERWPVFNPQQVFSAVFAQARGVENKLVSWGDLPTAIASELFREVLSSVNYEDIYKGDDPNRFPLPGIKARLRHAMRNNGILSYRVVLHRERRPLQAGMEYDLADLRVSHIQSLRNSKVLRDRGIKIISSGFGDLTPLSPEIWEQRVDNWSAPWVREMDTLRAEHGLEVERIRSHARAQAQQQLFYSLKRLFEDGNLTEEALAIRLYQSLEQAAANPLTRQLLPANTLDMMRTIHHWLIPGGEISRFLQGLKE
ncbi:MAG: hypothetical protein IT308_09520 [Anaerolineaceae bacterium]|nr:hypothetical protein [Anaerolineaceae bacterium]